MIPAGADLGHRGQREGTDCCLGRATEEHVALAVEVEGVKHRVLFERPMIAVGDGVPGFCAALAYEYPECRKRRTQDRQHTGGQDAEVDAAGFQE